MAALPEELASKLYDSSSSRSSSPPPPPPRPPSYNRGLQKKDISEYKEGDLSPTSHVIIYSYTDTIARESVQDFFYPPIAVKKLSHMSKKSLSIVETAKELSQLQMRRDILLLAFEAIQKLSPADKWSFFQISGIHGLPNTLYDDALDDARKNDSPREAADNDDYGYCQHGTPLFPTWHRPYVMLLEQSLIRHALLLPFSDSEEKDLVRDTIKKLRMPYWDWADHSSRTTGIPDIFTTTDINLLYPWKSFSRRTIPNPLKAFVSPRDVGTTICSDIYNPSAKPNYKVPPYSTPYMPAGYPTVRHVSSQFTTQNDSLNLQFLREVEQCLVRGVHDSFYIKHWKPFSNHSDCGKHGGSVESVHDHLHLIVGGSGGQMTYVDTAGFDPIFFFHHCNVDRLVALWQFCYPHAWITPSQDSQHSDRTIDEDSPLTPFRCSISNFLCSADVRDVERHCGYTYPELLQAEQEHWSCAEMQYYVQECLYKTTNSCVHRWFVVVEGIHKRAFNVPYQIRVFLDLPEANHTTSTSSPHYAGYVAVFARSNDSTCNNCAANEMAMQGCVEVTAAMLRLGHINLATAVGLSFPKSEKVPQDFKDSSNPITQVNTTVKLVFVTLCGTPLDPTVVPCWSTTGGPEHTIMYVGDLASKFLPRLLHGDTVLQHGPAHVL